MYHIICVRDDASQAKQAFNVSTIHQTHYYLISFVCLLLYDSIHSYLFPIYLRRYATEGFRDGTLVGGDSTGKELMRRITELRAECFSIGDLCAGRMPLAYVQLLQILVDTLVWLAPFSLFSGLGSLCIPLCAVLTHFFKGLLELSKSFLDPFGNDGYPDQNIRYVVLYLYYCTNYSWSRVSRTITWSCLTN